jgi:hypothetical protein
MILKAEHTIKSHDYDDLETLDEIKHLAKTHLADSIAYEMIKQGLIEIQESKGFEDGEIRIRATTVVLNPDQLSHISGMLGFSSARSIIMDEIKNK